MRFYTHVLFALFFYFLAIIIFNLNFSIFFALILCLGAILPDIDSPNSFINRKIKISKLVIVFSKHRGFFHSLFGILFFFIIGFMITLFIGLSLIYTAFFCFGYFLHLVADSMTISGVRWFWLSKKGHLQGKIKTGSIFENLLFVTLLILTICLFIKLPEFQKIIAFISKIKIKH